MTRRRVVVGYDGSESSRVALTWAMQAAQARGLPVLIARVSFLPVRTFAGFVTTIDSVAGIDAADQEMVTAAVHEARREVPGVDVSTTVVQGPVVPTLLELMTGAELAVVGRRGLGTFKELLVGSTSVQLATHVDCPLVVVRSTDFVEPGPEAGRVVVGVDGSAGAGAAVGFAFEEASLRGCGLTAVYGWDFPALDMYGWGRDVTDQMLVEEEEQTRRELSEALAGWTEKCPDVDVRHSLVRGEAARVLVDASAGAQVLAVGARGLGGFRSLMLGSVSHSVLQHAHAAVAIVRPHVT